MQTDIEPKSITKQPGLNGKENIKKKIPPFLAETMGYVSAFSRAANENESAKAAFTFASSAIDDIPRFEHYFSNIALIQKSLIKGQLASAVSAQQQAQIRAESDQKTELIQKALLDQVEVAVSHSSLSKWNSAKIEQLYKLGFTSQGKFAECIQSVKKGMFNIPNNPNIADVMKLYRRATELMQQAALAMVETDDERVREELYASLSFERPELKPYSLTTLTMLEAFKNGDAETVLKCSAITTAIAHTGILIASKQAGKPVMYPYSSLERIRKVSYVKSEITKRYDSFLAISSRISSINDVASRQLLKTALYNAFYGIAESGTEHLGPEDILPEVLTQIKDYEENMGIVTIDEYLAGKEYPKVTNTTGPRPILVNPLWSAIIERQYPQLVELSKQYYHTLCTNSDYRQLTSLPIETGGVELQVYAKSVQSAEHLKAQVREVYESLHRGVSVNPNRRVSPSVRYGYGFGFNEFVDPSYFDQDKELVFIVNRKYGQEVGSLGSVVEYYRPELTDNQIQKLDAKSGEIRGELGRNFKRSVTERGYNVVISDPDLRELGYKSIIFKAKGKSGFIDVAITVGGQEFKLVLNHKYQFEKTDDLKFFKSEADKNWLDILVLAHLKKAVCTDETDFEKILLDSTRQIAVYRRQISGRGEHMVQLPLGEGFTDTAKANYQASHFVQNPEHPQSLDDYNRSLGRIIKGVHRLYTFHKADNLTEIEDKPPIKFALSYIEELRSIVPLEEKSPEELDRITREIFSELFTQESQ